MFSSVCNIVNQRPIAIKNYTEEDYHAITPNDILLQRSKNTVPGVAYATEESVTRRQQVLKEIEDLWWQQWISQALPFLVPFKKWRSEERNVREQDIVLVHYGRSVTKGDYRLARVSKVHPDVHGRVRTVTVVFRKRDIREKLLPYVGKPLEHMTIGVQRLAVIFPAEEQVETGDTVVGDKDTEETVVGDKVAEENVVE